MKKKLLAILMVILALMSFAFMTACSDDEEPQGPPATDGGTQVVDTLKIDKKEISLMIDETVKITAEYEVLPDKTLTFESSDTAVATVDVLGNVKGVSEGTATVTAKYGDKQGTCKVTVDNKGIVPTLEFNQLTEKEPTVNIGQSIDLTAYILFNTKKYEDATITYTPSESLKGNTLVDGVFTGVIESEGTITVTASWRTSEKIEQVFAVKVGDLVQVLVNNGETSEVKLYMSEEVNGQQFAVSSPFNVETIVNGVDITPTSIAVEDTAVATVNGGVVTRVGLGSTRIEIKFSSATGKEYTTYIPVTVSRSRYTDTNTYYFDGVSDVNTMISYVTGNVNGAKFADGTALTTTGNKISGISEYVSFNESVKNIIVTTDNVEYALKVIPVTKAIYTASHLDELKVTGATDLNKGYFVLAKDVDYNGADFAHYSGITSASVCGFNGVFDGKGHAISNIQFGVGGLFGRLYGSSSSEKKEVKNVAFKNVSFKASTSDCSVLTVGCYSGTGGTTQNAHCNYSLTNIYIQVTTLPTAGSFGMISRDAINVHSKMENVVIDTGLSTTSQAQYGALCAYGITNASGMTNANNNVKNVYVLSKLYLAYWNRADKHTSDYFMDAKNQFESVAGVAKFGDFETYRDNTFVNGTDYSTVTVGQYERLCKFTGVERYESSSDFIAATNSAKVKCFTDTGLWSYDTTNGLKWVGATVQA